MDIRKYEFNVLCNLYKQSGGAEALHELFYANDFPIPYKNLLIYPVNVCLYQIFHSFADCLILDEEQLEGGDVKAIKMSYLSFLYYRAKKDKGIALGNLIEVLKMVLKVEGFLDDNKEIPCIGYAFDDKDNLRIRVFNDTYDHKDFNKIRKIICEQNCIEMPDMEMHPSLKKKYKEAQDFARKLNKNKVCSFEDMKSRITARTGLVREQLNNLTIREFTKLLESLEIIVTYDIETLLSPNMKKEDIKKIPHWLSEVKNTDKYKDYRTDLDKLKSDIKK